MDRADWSAVAELVFESTNGWYGRAGRPPVFACSPAELELYCRVYEDLDPGCCLLAEDPATGAILGSCFYHPRRTHVALGIMNVHPAAFGRGVARRLLSRIQEIAEARDLPVRLVSSASNLDSYSLYNRAGFQPYALFQDMAIEVPADGLPDLAPSGVRARPATLDDVEAIAMLEREVSGIERAEDFRYFLAGDPPIWHVSVVDDPEGGGLRAALASVASAPTRMLGPGFARDEDAALAVLAAELEQHHGGTPVVLVPADRPRLVRALYDLGARNTELHLAQVWGAVPRPPRGPVFPTFLPETG